jgi:hypothetical protein
VTEKQKAARRKYNREYAKVRYARDYASDGRHAGKRGRPAKMRREGRK